MKMCNYGLNCQNEQRYQDDLERLKLRQSEILSQYKGGYQPQERKQTDVSINALSQISGRFGASAIELDRRVFDQKSQLGNSIYSNEGNTPGFGKIPYLGYDDKYMETEPISVNFQDIEDQL